LNNEVRQTPVQYYEDEIDLYELFLVLKKRKRTVFAIALCFLIVATLYVLIASRVYKRSFIVRQVEIVGNVGNVGNVVVSSSEIKYLIDKLTKMIKFNDYERLSNELELPFDKARLIVNIKASIPRDDRRVVKVEVQSKSRDLLRLLPSHIVSYIERSSFFNRRVNVWAEFIREQKSLLANRLKNLQSLKDFIVNLLKNGSIKFIGFNPMELDGYILRLKSRVELLKTVETMLGKLQVVSIDPMPKKPYKPKSMLILTVSGISGLFMGIFVAFFLEWLDSSRERYKEAKSST